jgi:hypothetical protein
VAQVPAAQVLVAAARARVALAANKSVG